MFLPSTSDCIPSTEVWQARWIARQQAKLESEAAAKKTKVGFVVMNSWKNIGQKSRTAVVAI